MTLLFSQQVSNVMIGGDLNKGPLFNIIQDKSGFIWISTRFGAERFDGENMKSYPINILHSNRLPIRKTNIEIDNNDGLWLYTDRGTIYKYDEDKDEFVYFRNINSYLTTFCIDEDNNIWGGGTRSIFEIKDGKYSQYRDLIPHNDELFKISIYKGDNLLFTCKNNIYIFNKETKDLSPIIESKKIGGDITIETSFYDDKTEKIWIGSTLKGVYVYDIKSRIVKYLKDSRLSFHPVTSITDVNDKFLMIGMEGGGVCLLNKINLTVEKFYNEQNDMKLHIKSAVFDIYKDNEGRFWITTFSDGIKIVSYEESGFHLVQHEENNSNSLHNNIVCDILEDSDHNFWFASNNGLSHLDVKTGKWKKLLDSKNVLSVFEDSSERIWIGTFSSGAYLMDKQGRIIHNYTTSNTENSIGTNFIYGISEDSEGNIWFVGRKGPTSKLNLKTGVFTLGPYLQSNHVIVRDEKNMLISSESGIYNIPIETMSLDTCIFHYNLTSLYVEDMYLESDSIIWLATYGDGINRCNLINGNVQSFSLNDGLPSNLIFSIVPDNNKRLWFSSNNGIGFIDKENYNVVNFSTADGISGDTFRQVSRIKTHNNYIYFGSNNGATYFHPEKVKNKKTQGRLSLQNFRLFNQVVKSGEVKSPLDRALDKSTEIKLNYKQHSFSIDFTAVNFAIGEERRYMWKLDNLDADWIGPTSEHVANYTNLSPGEYKFNVKYLNSNNEVLDSRYITIDIAPPFWETIWARLIMLVIVLGAIILVYRYVDEYVRKKRMKDKLDFFINTVHDISTPLILISNPIEDLRKEILPTKKTDYLLNLISSNINKLNLTFSQLLEFQKAYQNQEKLIVKKVDIKDYLVNKAGYWNPIATQKEIDLKLELPQEEVEEWIDIEKMDKIMDNIISNAIKYTHSKGFVEISLHTDQNIWEIIVADNGIGIPKKEQKKLFQRFYRASNAINTREKGSGLGLLLIKQYMSLFKGSVRVDSIEGKGSEFYFKFRRGKDHFDPSIITEDYIDIYNDREEDLEKNNSKIKVLIAEDDRDLRVYLEQSLSKSYEVKAASNGAKAFDIIREFNPDLVISDLQMPIMDGFELCSKIKMNFETSHIPVILLTVVDDNENIEKGFSLGADDYMGKPFDMKLLKVKIENIIKNRKLIRLKFLGVEESVLQMNISDNEHNNEFIAKAAQIVEANIDNAAFSIADLSREIGVSRSLLFSKFNSIMGYTPNEFIKVVRMNRAIEYFKEKKYSINEVALMVGFDEPAYFSTCFKKIYSKSPSAFIEENLK